MKTIFLFFFLISSKFSFGLNHVNDSVLKLEVKLVLNSILQNDWEKFNSLQISFEDMMSIMNKKLQREMRILKKDEKKIKKNEFYFKKAFYLDRTQNFIDYRVRLYSKNILSKNIVISEVIIENVNYYQGDESTSFNSLVLLTDTFLKKKIVLNLRVEKFKNKIARFKIENLQESNSIKDFKNGVFNYTVLDEEINSILINNPKDTLATMNAEVTLIDSSLEENIPENLAILEGDSILQYKEKATIISKKYIGKVGNEVVSLFVNEKYDSHYDIRYCDSIFYKKSNSDYKFVLDKYKMITAKINDYDDYSNGNSWYFYELEDSIIGIVLTKDYKFYSNLDLKLAQ